MGHGSDLRREKALMLSQYGHIFLFILLSVCFPMLTLMLTSLIRHRSGDARQKIPYECGMEPVGSPYIPIDIRFYLFALLFVIFDVESLFLFPWAVIFRESGWMGLLEMGFFIAVTFFGLMYAWMRGALRWES